MSLYSTTGRASGGRNGKSETLDGGFSVDLAMPKELGGTGNGANPEQLFAAGYAACFDSAIQHVARQDKLALKGSTVSVSVSLNPNDKGFALDVDIEAEIEGLDQGAAETLVAKAHAVCPYSNAIRGNIDVTPTVKTV